MAWPDRPVLLGESISSIFTKRKLDDDTLQDLEDILIQADLGVETAMTITERLADGRYNKEVSGEEVQKILADEVNEVLEPSGQTFGNYQARRMAVRMLS